MMGLVIVVDKFVITIVKKIIDLELNIVKIQGFQELEILELIYQKGTI